MAVNETGERNGRRRGRAVDGGTGAETERHPRRTVLAIEEQQPPHPAAGVAADRVVGRRHVAGRPTPVSVADAVAGGGATGSAAESERDPEQNRRLANVPVLPVGAVVLHVQRRHLGRMVVGGVGVELFGHLDGEGVVAVRQIDRDDPAPGVRSSVRRRRRRHHVDIVEREVLPRVAQIAGAGVADPREAGSATEVEQVGARRVVGLRLGRIEQPLGASELAARAGDRIDDLPERHRAAEVRLGG